MSGPNQQKIIQQKYAEQQEFELIEQCVGGSQLKQIPQLLIQPISAHAMLQAQMADRIEQTQKLRDLLEQVSLKSEVRSRSVARLLPSATIPKVLGSNNNMLLTLENATRKRDQSPQTPQMMNKRLNQDLPISPSAAPIIEMSNNDNIKACYYQESHSGNFKQVFKKNLNQRDEGVFSFNSSTKEHTNGAPSTNNVLFRLKPNSNLLQKTLKTSLQHITQGMQSEFNQLKVVNDLIYNEQSHTVTVFKDYLILDDINEFLKRPYSKVESKQRLPKLCSFYDSYSQVFPNYVCLPESKYMFKNIQKKQKLIDEQNQTKHPNFSLVKEDRLFDTKFKDSVQNQQMSRDDDLNLSMLNQADIKLTHSRKRSSDAPNLFKKHAKLSPSMSPRGELQNLMEMFIQKDTQQSMQLDLSMNQEFVDSFFKHSARGMGRFEGRTSQIQSYIGDESIVLADFSDTRQIPEDVLKQAQPYLLKRPSIQTEVKKKLLQPKPVQQKQKKTLMKSKSPDNILKTSNPKPTYYNRNAKAATQQSPLAMGLTISKNQTSQEKLTVKIPKAIKTLELNRPPQQPKQTLGTSPSLMITPRAHVGEEENVDEFLDVEINRGRVVAELRKMSAGSDTAEEDTVRSDGTKTNQERERFCPSALIMAGGMSSLNTHSQSVRGSVIGLISASKHQQSMNSVVTRAKTSMQNLPPYMSQARTPAGIMTRHQSPQKSSTVSSPVNQKKQTPRSTDRPTRYQPPTIYDIKTSQDFGKIKKHLENVYLSGKISQASLRTATKPQTPLAKVLEERQTQFDLKFKGLLGQTTKATSNQNSRSNLPPNMNQLVPQRGQLEANTNSVKTFLQSSRSKVPPVAQCRLQTRQQSKSPTQVLPFATQTINKRRSSKTTNEYRPLQTGKLTLTRTGLSASSASPTPTQQVCIADTHNTRVLYSSILMQTTNRSPANLPLPTKPRNISPQTSMNTFDKNVPKTSQPHFILPSQKKPQFFGQQQIQAMGAVISKKQLNLN